MLDCTGVEAAARSGNEKWSERGSACGPLSGQFRHARYQLRLSMVIVLLGSDVVPHPISRGEQHLLPNRMAVYLH